MTAVNDPDLGKIALKIVSAPDFNPDFDKLENDSARRALGAWFAAVTPQQRIAAEKAFILRHLLNVYAEYRRDGGDTGHAPSPAPVLPTAPAPTAADEPGDTPTAQVAVLRFSSESDSWSKPPIPAEITGPERFPSLPKHRTPPPQTPRYGPVVISHVSDRQPESKPAESVRTPAPRPIQQDSTKVAQFQRWFPQTNLVVQIDGVTKRIGELADAREVRTVRDRERKKQRAWKNDNTHENARIAERDKQNHKGRVANAERMLLIRESEALEAALAAVEPALAEHGASSIFALSAEVLERCGFERRSA